jgi:rhodanese-related sulfurtransferase
VFVLPEAGNEQGAPNTIVLGTPSDKAVGASAALESDDLAVVDLSASPHYRRGHIPGAWFAIRARLDRALKKIAPTGEVILTSEDGVLASLAVAEAQTLTDRPVHWLKGGNAAWTAAGFPLSIAEKMADEPLDVWLKPYERPNDNEAAMNAYLSWEVDLLERIKKDGTTHFLHAR